MHFMHFITVCMHVLRASNLAINDVWFINLIFDSISVLSVT